MCYLAENQRDATGAAYGTLARPIRGAAPLRSAADHYLGVGGKSLAKKNGREKNANALPRKKRAPSNRVGERGEKHFDAVAADYGLIATAIKNDYGFDFLCQVDEDPSSSQSSGLHGTFVGVAVRATTKADGRIKLARADADALLRAHFVTMVALVHLPKNGSASISVRILDAAFRKELAAFLSGTRESIRTHRTRSAPCLRCGRFWSRR